MVRHNPMPDLNDDTLELPQLFKKLASDGARWADAEFALARAEAGNVLQGYLAGLAIAILCFAMAISALVIFAQGAAIALTPYVHGPFLAHVTVGLMIAVLIVILGLVSRHLLVRKHKPLGMIFKWLVGNSGEK
jgi:hypothetical protein